VGFASDPDGVLTVLARKYFSGFSIMDARTARDWKRCRERQAVMQKRKENGKVEDKE